MRTRLYAAGILGGLTVLAVAVFVVFQFGRKDPSPPSLQDHPNPAIPGEVLYLDSTYCFVQAAASGASRTLRACVPGPDSGMGIYWLADDTAAVVRYDSRGPVLWEVDLATGQQRDTGKVLTAADGKPSPIGPGVNKPSPDGAYASTDSDGGLFLIENGVRTEIASFDVPRYHQPVVIGWSPDGKWILLTYMSPRGDRMELWVVSRDGQTKGTLATDLAPVSGAAWRMDGLPTQPAVP